jgi:quercetin dioxygenase-like cupin family protein
VSPAPVFLEPGAGEAITDRAERTVLLLLSHDLLDVTWTRYEPGERGPDPHVHRQHTDAFYVLEGELLFGVGPDVEEVRAPAGTFVAVPPDVVHTFRNESSGRACFLNLHAPSGGFADFLRGVSESFDSFDPPDGGRPAAEAIVSGSGAGERVGGDLRTHRIKADLPHLSVIELGFGAGWEGVDPHTHDDHVDAFYVLGGEIAFTLDEGETRAGPGTFFAAPPGARHGFRHPGDGRVSLLNVHAPDVGFAGRLRRRG